MLSASRLLLTSIALSLTVVPAIAQDVACFGSGIQGNCTSAVTSFCSSIQNITVGGFDNVSRCINENGLVCNLVAWNNRPGNGGNTPSVTNCIKALTTVSEVCPLGGSGSFQGGNFVFTAIPNLTSCGSNAALGE